MTTSVSNVVPAENVIHPARQPQPAWHLRRQPVRQRHRECPVARAEPNLLLTESALRHRQLVAQGEDLHVRVPIAHRQQAQQGERVRPAQVGRSQQHGWSSCRVGRQPRDGADPTDLARHPVHPSHRLRPARTRSPASAGPGVRLASDSLSLPWVGETSASSRPADPQTRRPADPLGCSPTATRGTPGNLQGADRSAVRKATRVLQALDRTIPAGAITVATADQLAAIAGHVLSR